MNNQNKCLLALFLLFHFSLIAQHGNDLFHNSCITDQLHQKMLEENISYRTKHTAFEKQIYNLNYLPTYLSRKSMTTQTIPVVVHVIHQNGPENISDEQVFDAIQHLNDAFKNIGIYDPSTGVDVEIDFCLATRSPQNEETNGINRIESALTNVNSTTQDLDLKALLQWNPLDYMNVWVVHEITSASAGPGVVGYAYFPAAHGMPQDGIVIEANFFGASQDDSKVMVHEVGHYLGLYHTFEGGCTNNNCLLDGDRICDTPPDQSIARISCDEEMNTCHSDEDDTSTNNPFRPIALGGLGDQNDMISNYMDYSDLPCFSAFTLGQKERMKNVLASTRKSLLESLGCQELCPFPDYQASFMSNAGSPVLVGDMVEFTNTSDPADIYEWSIEDQIFSTSQNASYTFDEEGIFTISLVIRDSINKCENSYEQIIEVLCSGEASFTTASTEISPGETLDFINTSSAENISYQWFLDGSFYSAETDLSITFTDPGIYSLFLLGETSTCLNYSSTISIIVGSCSAENKSEMNWHFGEFLALDFNSGEPISVQESELCSFEGTSSMSDENGNLLFYTNGLSIWDATNNIMQNGDGLLGGNNRSAVDQALVLPRPFHEKQYYVFTCDDFEDGQDNGIRYSIVDMTLNGGLGAVTDIKNTFLCPATGEAMSATFHKDKKGVWLVIPNENALNAYPIDAVGIGAPVTYINPNFDNRWTLLRFFNSGKRLIVGDFLGGAENLIIFDFDNSKGVFSNPVFIDTGKVENGIFECSPDDSKLYAIIGNDYFSTGIYQFDLSLTSGTQISNSKTFIGSIPLISRLLLAPNGKIYNTIFGEIYLGAINNPNAVGIDCNYDPQAVNLGKTNLTVSLPKFIRGQGFSAGPNLDLGLDKNVCNGLATVLDPGNLEDDLLWQDGSTDPTYTAWLPGTYWVTATNECGTFTDSIDVIYESSNLVDLGPDQSFCQEDELTLDAGNAGDFFLWQDGSSQSTLQISESGLYWVQVTDEEGCSDVDSIVITLDAQAPIIDCPMDIDTIVSSGVNELLINPGLPFVDEECGNVILVNDINNTNSALGFYPLGTTTVTWTVSDERGNTATCSMDVNINMTTGTADLNNEASSLVLYPNPSNGLFFLKETKADVGEIQLDLFDALGRKIYELSYIIDGIMPIDLTDQAEGVYFLHWSTGENSGVFKLINQF